MKVIASSIVALFASVALANAPAAHGTTGTAATTTETAAPAAPGKMDKMAKKTTKADCDKMTDAAAKTKCEAELKAHK